MRGKNITLHPTKGVNPRLTFCPRCRGPAREIIMLGNNDKAGECAACGVTMFGAKTGAKCESCGEKAGWLSMRTIEDQERLPGGLCESCETEVEEHSKVVAAGGALFRCADCHASGVIKPDVPLVAMARSQMGLDLPREDGSYAPCGVEFTKDDCPACGPNAVVESG